MKRLSVLLIALVALAGCSTSLGVNRTAIEDVSTTNGIADLYLYGKGSLGDPVKVAIIDLVNDDFNFHIMAPGSQYELIPGIEISRATALAEEFVGGWGTCTDTILTNSIVSDAGQVVGYEFRALYSSPLRGVEDPVLTSYWIREQGDVGVNVTAKDANYGSVHCNRG